MENEQSINNVLSEFERDQRMARVFNTAATVVGVLAAIGLIGLVVVIAYKYTSTEKALTGEVTQTRSELETRLGELELTKTELNNQQMELTRLQERVKSGSASGEVITNLQRDLQTNQVKLANANEQISELNKLMANIKDPNDAVATLTRELTQKESHINLLKNQVVEKNNIIASKDRTITEKDKVIENLRKKGAVKIPVN